MSGPEMRAAGWEHQGPPPRGASVNLTLAALQPAWPQGAGQRVGEAEDRHVRPGRGVQGARGQVQERSALSGLHFKLQEEREDTGG